MNLVALILLYISKEHYTVGETLQEIITLPNGKIKGHTLKTLKNNSYLAFQEIPYATPPVGKLRFKDPIPSENWKGILDTTKNTKTCFQSFYSETENEDCLYLNVYTPLDKHSNLPVLFYIFGGAFLFGNGTFEYLGPDFFIDQNIIIVTCNLRLGPFGFLSTQDTVISGNQALKDQNLALKWVQSNIHLFGGDPSKVTIMGESSGAAGVGYQLISEKSKGLFRGAILQSSTCSCSWAYQNRAREIAYQLAIAIDKTFSWRNSSEELLKLLQSQPATTIRNAEIPGLGLGIQIGQGYTWAPVIEIPTQDSFVSKLPDESINQGNINKIPILIGINSEEKIVLAENLTAFKNEMAEYDKNVSLLVKECYHINHTKLETVGTKLRSIYTSGLFQSDLGASIRFRSDSRYTTAVVRHAELQSKYTKVYFYQFSYDGVMGEKLNIHLKGADTVAHAAELNYLWSNSKNRNIKIFPAEDIVTHDRLIKLWTNFVKYLNPTPTEDKLFANIIWPTFSSNGYKYLNINNTLEVKCNPKEYKKWKEIIDVYGNPPFATY